MKTATYYHCSLKPISRSAGKSVVNCAAYRTGSRLEDEHYGTVRDFTYKKDVVTSFTVAPDGAPDWARDPEQLWNAVEKRENRKNSILANEWEVAAPNELDDAHRENIARNIAGWLKTEYGVAVTVGIHNGGDRGNGMNDHFHILMTTRAVTEDGWASNKLRQFTTQPGKPNPEVDRVRTMVAGFINTTLSDNGSEERVDARSYAERGIPVEGTKHLGPAASACERQGIETDRGAINREIIEARLLWQQEEAQPEITAELEREFVQRFGDDARQGTQSDWVELENDTPPEGQEAESADAQTRKNAEKGTETNWRDAKHGEGSDRRSEHTAWEAFAGRVRGYWERLSQFAHDQSSGTPSPQQQPEAGSPDSDGEAKKSWVARVMESKAVTATRHLLHGWGYRDGLEVLEGLKETGTVVEDILATGPQRCAAEPASEAQATQPAAPLEGWERFHQSARATPEPEAKALEGWERFHRNAHAKQEANTSNPTPLATQPRPDAPAPASDSMTPEL